jgi:hypothetical protein
MRGLFADTERRPAPAARYQYLHPPRSHHRARRLAACVRAAGGLICPTGSTSSTCIGRRRPNLSSALRIESLRRFEIAPRESFGIESFSQCVRERIKCWRRGGQRAVRIIFSQLSGPIQPSVAQRRFGHRARRGAMSSCFGALAAHAACVVVIINRSRRRSPCRR